MADQPHLAEEILRTAIKKGVSEKLGSFNKELLAFTKDMMPEDIKDSKIMMLDMMQLACADFFIMMKDRLRDKKGSSE